MAAIGVMVGLAISEEVDAVGCVVVESAVQSIPRMGSTPSRNRPIGKRIYKFQSASAVAWCQSKQFSLLPVAVIEVAWGAECLQAQLGGGG